LATKSKQTVADEKRLGPLSSAWESAWGALQPIRSTWDEKEQALMAQTNDSVSGNITATRVSDAALSTLAYERQARVTAQLPTGRIYAMSKKEDERARVLNIVTTRYILPNANSQFDMLIKLRLWGVYASVYGSMPMLYDYRVDQEGGYIGPDCWLIDPRCFAPIEGSHNVQEAGCYISTIMHKEELEAILDRKTTSYNKPAIRKLLKMMEGRGSNGKGAKPSKDSDSNKNNTTVGQRYDLSNATDRIEVVTKYTKKRWVMITPDYCDLEAGEDLVIRDMENPHKSGRIPVVMRHCFPLLNSIFGLGDYERGMKVQKAKDSILNLFLEGAKMRVYPPLKMIDNLLTPSTIRYQAGTKWKVKQMNAVEAHQSGPAPLQEFQATYAALSGIQQNMFGTSNTDISEDQGGPAAGKTPEAIRKNTSRENARDAWDRFMGEKATEELIEGMINLLQVKQEKPIKFIVHEDDIQALGWAPAEVGEDGQETKPAKKVEGLEVYDGAKAGKMVVNKSDIKADNFYSFIIDANSSMRKDDEEQFQAAMATWQLTHQDPGLVQRLAQQGMEYDEADHLKKIFIAAGLSDWEKTLKEISPEKMAQLKQAANQAGPMPSAGGADPMAQMAALMGGGGGMPPGGAPQQGMPMPPQNMGAQPGQAPMMDPAQAQMLQQQMQQPQPQPMQQQIPMGPQLQQMPNFEDPQIAQIAQQMLAGAPQ
jgi:hypothetical protein